MVVNKSYHSQLVPQSSQVFTTLHQCKKFTSGNAVTEPNTRRGFVWDLYFLKNPGTSNGYTFPHGSGDIALPELIDAHLNGSDATGEAYTIMDGIPPLGGSFKLSVGDGIFTNEIPYDSDNITIKKSISELSNAGKVSVNSGLVTGH